MKYLWRNYKIHSDNNKDYLLTRDQFFFWLFSTFKRLCCLSEWMVLLMNKLLYNQKSYVTLCNMVFLCHQIWRIILFWWMQLIIRIVSTHQTYPNANLDLHHHPRYHFIQFLYGIDSLCRSQRQLWLISFSFHASEMNLILEHENV